MVVEINNYRTIIPSSLYCPEPSHSSHSYNIICITKVSQTFAFLTQNNKSLDTNMEALVTGSQTFIIIITMLFVSLYCPRPSHSSHKTQFFYEKILLIYVPKPSHSSHSQLNFINFNILNLLEV